MQKGNLKKVFCHLYYGIKYKIPICCVWQFCIDTYKGIDDNAEIQGCYVRNCGFVHCDKCSKKLHK